MPANIRIRPYGSPIGPFVGGMRTELNGVEVKSVRTITIPPMTVDEVVRVNLELLPDDLDFSCPGADVTVSIVALPGYEIVETVDAAGFKRYRAVRELL